MDSEKQQDLTSLKGEIRVPYEWKTGVAPGKFLTALRDSRTILGARCPSCGTTYVPPQEYCGPCFKKITEYKDVGDEGEVITFTVVHKPLLRPPADPPYILALIQLDRSSTSFVHLLGEINPDDVKTGMRVKAVWKEEREGSILDIKYFKPIK